MSNSFKGFRRVEIPKAIEAAKQLDGIAIYKRTVERDTHHVTVWVLKKEGLSDLVFNYLRILSRARKYGGTRTEFEVISGDAGADLRTGAEVERLLVAWQAGKEGAELLDLLLLPWWKQETRFPLSVAKAGAAAND